jgi:hypothetical protein
VDAVEWRDGLHHVCFDERGIEVDDAFVDWERVGALGILEKAGFVGGRLFRSGPIGGIPIGCLAIAGLRAWLARALRRRARQRAA